MISCKQGANNKSNSSSTTLQKKDDTIKTMTPSKEYSQAVINEMLDSSFRYGNQSAYNKVSNYYLLNSLDEEFLFYALIMANRYHEPAAYYDVYEILTLKTYDNHLENIDSTTRAIAIYYLLKAHELGYESSKYPIEQIFTSKNRAIPKSSDYIIFKKTE